MDRPLRLISTNPVDQLARTVEALLVVASQPLSADELAAAADDDRERVETALGLLGERYREGRSGIVLERVAGGWAFRASREAAAACGRLFERPVEQPAGHLLDLPDLLDAPGELLGRLLGVEVGEVDLLVGKELARLQLEERADEHEELAAGVEVEPLLRGEPLAERDDDRSHVDVGQLQLLP